MSLGTLSEHLCFEGDRSDHSQDTVSNLEGRDPQERLTYLLSRPDDWKVLVNDLKKRGNLGRDGIYALLRDLRQAGYGRFERNRDAQGRMRGGTYIVSEIPHPVNAGALPNTDRKQRTTTTTRPTDTYRAATATKDGLRFPDWLPADMHAPATRLVAGLDSADAQLVIDEWGARWRPVQSSDRRSAISRRWRSAARPAT